jgi:hypothetical protein
MARELQAERSGWIEALGLPQIARTPGIALRPGKLGVAFVGIMLTLSWGWVLDFAWTRVGGIGEDAIGRYIASAQTGMLYDEPAGQSGIFAVYRDQVAGGVVGFFRSTLSADPSSPGVGRSLIGLVGGTTWLLREHFVFFLLFAAGALFIWSVGGGTICRMCALEVARDERPGIRDAFGFAREHFFGGYFLAPCVPIVFALFWVIVLVVFGMVLRVPILGDFLAGVLFCVAIILGFVVAVLFVGLIVGGSLFWPTVAAEGSDAFDAFHRGLSYTLSKPWKTVIYGALMIAFTAICWLVARAFTYAALMVTRTVVGFGTSPFGWWARGPDEAAVSKLELLWPLPSAGAWYTAPNWAQLGWYEHVSAFLIWVYVLIVIGVLWAFLCSFYFSGSTVLYFLLRRDVDGVELEDVYIEEPFEPTRPAEAPGAKSATSSSSPTDASDSSRETGYKPPSDAASQNDD